jgi:hypothetical protein
VDQRAGVPLHHDWTCRVGRDKFLYDFKVLYDFKGRLRAAALGHQKEAQ